MRSRAAALVTAIVAWHLLCYAAIHGFSYAFAFLVFRTDWFDGIDVSDPTVARIVHLVEIVLKTLPATWLSLCLFNVLARLPRGWKRTAATLFLWEAAVVAALMWAREVALFNAINQLGRSLFGPPDDLDGFWIVALPRVIAWVLCTTPLAVVALCGHAIWASRTEREAIPP